VTGPVRIILGVCGGIGAYKAAELLRQLQQRGAEVSVVMTRHATEFIAPLTMQVLSGRPVMLDMFDLSAGADIEHLSLVRRTDLLLVAPATANIIGKLAWGVADDPLSTLATAIKCPVLLAPAMNTRMWTSPAVEENVERLKGRGVSFVEPERGELACGEEGEGRLADPAVIAEAAMRLARRSRSLARLRVLVTAGPTREPIDPVRYLSNRSSGKMGYAIASALARRGARVVLVSGPTSLPGPYGVERIDVTTADEMQAAVLRRLPRCHALWMVAAVADFRARDVATRKITKARQGPVLPLARTPDILASAARMRRRGQILVGFAAETDRVLARAREKLEAKGLDFIVANDVSREGVGFDVDTNAVTLLPRKGRPVSLPKASKVEIAEALVDLVHPPPEERSRGASRREGRSRPAGRLAARVGHSDRGRAARPGASGVRRRARRARG
jgi:phosphopantothenoylcysteine decarboxylase/phosphopantothenate--cysteine ligase